MKAFLLGSLLFSFQSYAGKKPYIQLVKDTAYIEPFDSVVPPVIAYDSVGGSVTVYHYGKIDSSHLGIYTAFCYCRDKSGNVSDTLSFKIVVWDRIPPAISLVGGDHVYFRKGDKYIEPGVIVVDNYDSMPKIFANGSFTNTHIPGIYTLNYQARDFSGNMSRIVTRYIIINDTSSGINDAIYNTAPIKIWPNPANDFTYLQIGNSIPQSLEIYLYDQAGRRLNLIAKGCYPLESVIQVDVRELQQGIYFIEGILGGKPIQARLIISK